MNILAQLPPEIASLFSERGLIYATAAWLLLQNLGRAWHAIMTHGGLRGIWRALIFGTNIPKQTSNGNGQAAAVTNGQNKT